MQEVGIGDAGADAGADDDDDGDGRYGSDWTGMDCGWRSSSRLGDRKLCAGEGDSSEQKGRRDPIILRRRRGHTGGLDALSVCHKVCACICMCMCVENQMENLRERERTENKQSR